MLMYLGDQILIWNAIRVHRDKRFRRKLCMDRVELKIFPSSFEDWKIKRNHSAFIFVSISGIFYLYTLVSRTAYKKDLYTVPRLDGNFFRPISNTPSHKSCEEGYYNECKKEWKYRSQMRQSSSFRRPPPFSDEIQERAIKALDKRPGSKVSEAASGSGMHRARRVVVRDTCTCRVHRHREGNTGGFFRTLLRMQPPH